MTTHPWRKFWIGIQSDLIKDIPKSVSGPFRINPKNLLNLVRCESLKNQSDLFSFCPKLQSEWIRIEFSIRGRNDSDWKYDWINSDWKLGRIHSDGSFGLNWIESNWFATDLYKTRLQNVLYIDTEWLGKRFRIELLFETFPRDRESFGEGFCMFKISQISSLTIPHQYKKCVQSRFIHISCKSIRLNQI